MEKFKLKKLKRRLLKHVWLVRIVLFILFLIFLYLIFAFTFSLFKRAPFYQQTRLVQTFLFTPDGAISSINGRTNLIILGKGGGDHEAPELTDTIMFVSVSHESGEIDIISLPRDIWVPELRAKLNSAYYWGNQKREGGGMLLAKSSVEKIIGQPIQYGIVIDFSGFSDLIDALGGVEVDVQNGFVDKKYPIAGRENDECSGDPEYLCRYEEVRFEKGVQTMDGQTALKFVRSRNAEGDEGTDIARTNRQQQVMLAIQKKMVASRMFLKPKKIDEILRIVESHVETDLEPISGAVIARRLIDVRGNITTHTISEEFLVNPQISSTYDNLYVFIPKAGDWSEVHGWVESVLF